MGEKFVRDDTAEYVEAEEYVTEQPRRPAPGLWLAGLLLFATLGASLWFWYKAETSPDRPLAVIGQDGPKIIVNADEDAPARYIIVREGNTSRVVGGSAVASSGNAGETSTSTINSVDGGTSRAETIATYTTTNVDEFAGPDADVDRIGQTITIENGRVHEATGDKTFSLHAENGETLMVFFPEPNTRAGETAYKIIGGDNVTVTGTLREMPSTTQARRVFGLSEREAADLTNDKVYLDAYQIMVH